MILQRAACVLVLGTMIAGCATIPDHVLEQEQQRRQLLYDCTTALKAIENSPRLAELSLARCREHQILADKMMQDFISRAKQKEPWPIEIRLAERLMNDLEDIFIRECYAEVRLGEPVSDSQGHTGVAVCDVRAEDRRHRQTLEAIGKTRKQIQRDIILYRR